MEIHKLLINKKENMNKIK